MSGVTDVAGNVCHCVSEVDDAAGALSARPFAPDLRHPSVDLTRAAAVQCKNPYEFDLEELWNFLSFQWAGQLTTANAFYAESIDGGACPRVPALVARSVSYRCTRSHSPHPPPYSAHSSRAVCLRVVHHTGLPVHTRRILLPGLSTSVHYEHEKIFRCLLERERAARQVRRMRQLCTGTPVHYEQTVSASTCGQALPYGPAMTRLDFDRISTTGLNAGQVNTPSVYPLCNPSEPPLYPLCTPM